MTEKKLSTAEILAMARKQAGGGAQPPSAAEPAAPGAEPAQAAEPAPATAADVSAAPPAAPKSTADILAAARAQAAKPASAAPKSTADILAAARAQAAKPAAASPKSTADILAAARAQKGAAPAAAPAAGSSAPSVAPAAPTGLAVKEMVAAVKQAQSGQPAAPKLPSAPAKPKLPEKPVVGRRSFGSLLAALTITPFALAWGSLAAVGGLWTLAAARFLMPNMVRELPSSFKVGSPSDFPPNTVSEKYTASRGIWIVNTDQYNGKPLLYALASVCTHLGCTPSWLAGEQKFKCPCHGSGFYINGINFEGPAPRPLERVGLSIAPDGLLEVDKSVKFQEELGQWSDPKSFVELG